MKVNTTLSLDHEIKAKAKKKASKKGISLSAYIEQLIEEDQKLK